MPRPDLPLDAVRSLRQAAWAGGSLIVSDPIGVLLPSSLSLVLQAWAMWVTVQTGAWTWALGAWCVWWAMSIPLRQRTLLVAARQLPGVTPVRGQALAFIGLHLLLGPLLALPVTLGVVVGVVPAVQLATAGWLAPAAAMLALGVCIGGFLGAVVRGACGWAPAEVLFGGRSAYQALRASTQRGGSSVVSGIVLVLMGDLAVLFGSLWCGAGALPGYPWSDLGLLHQWAERSEDAAW